MAEKQLTIENAEPLLLFGFNDIYLRKVENAFPDTQITARGNKVILRGASASIDRVERVLNELILVLNRNNNLTENDVETVLALFTVAQGVTGTRSTGGQNVLLFTPNGGMIKARTPNQIRLVNTARNNDIVFAIGPAGTGKTFVALALAVAAFKS